MFQPPYIPPRKLFLPMSEISFFRESVKPWNAWNGWNGGNPFSSPHCSAPPHTFLGWRANAGNGRRMPVEGCKASAPMPALPRCRKRRRAARVGREGVKHG